MLGECHHGAWIAKRDRLGRRIGPYICGVCGRRITNLEQTKIMDWLVKESDRRWKEYKKTGDPKILITG